MNGNKTELETPHALQRIGCNDISRNFKYEIQESFNAALKCVKRTVACDLVHFYCCSIIQTKPFIVRIPFAQLELKVMFLIAIQKKISFDIFRSEIQTKQ